MKIASIDILQLKVEGMSSLRPVVCRINTDTGLYGYGEAGLAIVSGAIAAYELIKDYGRVIIGMNPLHHETIWEKLFKDTFWAQGNGAVIMAAISAIDTALWDIKGKYYNAPIYELLGGKQRSKLWTYASQLQFGWGIDNYDRDGAIDKYRRACEAAKMQGYTAVKANFFEQQRKGPNLNYLNTTGFLSAETMNTAEERIAAVRDIMGPDGRIILENHAMTDACSSVQYARMAEKYDIMFMEEPATPLNEKVFKNIADKINIPLATGERTFTRWGFRSLFENGSIAVAQPDIGNCGGITECKKICDMAHLYDIGIQTHVCSSPISVAVSLQLEAAIPNFVIHEHHVGNTIPGVRALGKYDHQPHGSYFDVPDLPGIGQELSQQALDTVIKAEIVQ